MLVVVLHTRQKWYKLIKIIMVLIIIIIYYWCSVEENVKAWGEKLFCLVLWCRKRNRSICQMAAGWTGSSWDGCCLLVCFELCAETSLVSHMLGRYWISVPSWFKTPAAEHTFLRQFTIHTLRSVNRYSHLCASFVKVESWMITVSLW